MRPLLYLSVRRFINSLKRAPSNPRVLLPGIFFIIMVGLVVVGGIYSAPHAAHAVVHYRPRSYVTGGPGALVGGLRTLLLISVFSSLVASLGEGGIFFTPADVDFLFPAPLSPRAVLFFKMMARYGQLLFPSVYLPLVLGGVTLAMVAGVSPLRLWPGMLGVWLFLVATTNLTQTALLGRSGAKDSADDERSAKLRGTVRTILYVIGAVIVVGMVFSVIRASSGTNSMGQAIHNGLAWINGPGVSKVLLPVTWATDLVQVTFEGWTAHTLLDLLALFVTVAATFLLLFSRQRDFYESALDTSEKRTRMVSAMRSGDAGSILTQMAQEGKIRSTRTAPTLGTGAMAVLWKDVVSITRTPPRSWGILLFVAAFPAVLGLVIGGGSKSDFSILTWLGLFTMNMANLFLLSLRDMLRRADLTKALPITPRRMLLGELALSIVQLTVLGWFSLGLMALTGVAQRGPLFLPIVLTLPSLAALLLFVQTIFVLLYPQRQSGGNGDAVQGGVANLAGAFAGGVALLPRIIVGASLYILGASRLWLGIGVAFADSIAAIIALQIASMLWQRFDPSDG